MLKKHCPIIGKVNNDLLQNKLILYQKNNPCCELFGNCKHPKYQSNGDLQHHFPIFKDSLNSIFKSIEIQKMWCFITFPKNTVNSGWHSHNDKYIENAFSAVCYLTDTNVGTEFKDGFIIEPNINTWYIWDSNLEHRPVIKYMDKLRITIAADINLN